MLLNHPETFPHPPPPWSMEKFVFHKTDPLNQKGCGPLVLRARPLCLENSGALYGCHAYTGNELYNQLTVQLRKLFVAITLESGREWAHNEYLLNE